MFIRLYFAVDETLILFHIRIVYEFIKLLTNIAIQISIEWRKGDSLENGFFFAIESVKSSKE